MDDQLKRAFAWLMAQNLVNLELLIRHLAAGDARVEGQLTEIARQRTNARYRQFFAQLGTGTGEFTPQAETPRGAAWPSSNKSDVKKKNGGGGGSGGFPSPKSAAKKKKVKAK